LLESEPVTLLRFIASRLRELRKKHELTQEQVANLLGTDLKWYQRVEWCEKDVRASTVDRLAAAFGVSTLEFLARETPATKVKARIARAPHRPRKSARTPKPKG
jgi:transcriptional regulator with XRE-family HTH domain